MRIGELARRTGLQTVTIRYYEKAGLLPEPGRAANNYRDYGEAHVARLSFIRHCRQLDMALAEIQTLLEFSENPAESCETVNGLLDEHIEHVEARIRELKTLRADLKSLRERCRDPRAADACGILQGLQASAPERPMPAGVSHVSGSHE